MIALLYFAVLGVVLWITYGMINPLAVGLLTISTFAFAWFAPRKTNERNVLSVAIAIIVLFFALLLLRAGGLMYPPEQPDLQRILLYLNLILIATTLAFVGWALRWFITRREGVFLTVLACVIAYAYYLVIRIVPVPLIDVFVINSLATDHLLGGTNPYTVSFPDIYQGGYGYTPGFTYWPAYLLASIPSRIAGDIRLANFAALIFCAWGYFRLNRLSGGSRTEAQLAVLLLASFPVGFFVFEQTWIDTILSALTVALALLLHHQKWIWAGVLAGVAAATKQYGFLIAAPTLIYILARVGWRPFLSSTLAAAVVSLAFLLPFVFWDFGAFYKNTIDLLVKIPNRPDSLSIPALYFHYTGNWPPGLLLILSYLATLGGALLYLFRRPSVSLPDWIFSIALLHAVIFLMGKQAFCNYYYLLATFVLLLFCVRRQWHAHEPSEQQ